MTFDEIMAPLGAEAFLARLSGPAAAAPARRGRQVPGGDELGGAEPAPRHDHGLAARPCCSILDKKPCPPPAYASTAPGRDGGAVLRPDPVRVQQHPGARRHHGPQLHRPADPGAVGLRAGAGARRSGGRSRPISISRPSASRASRPISTSTTSSPMHVMGEKTWIGVPGPGRLADQASDVRGLAARAPRRAQGRALARGPAAARRPALSAARAVPLRPRGRRALRARRLGRHLPDRHGRGQLRVRADGRRSRRPREPAPRPRALRARLAEIGQTSPAKLAEPQAARGHAAASGRLSLAARDATTCPG